MTKEHFDNILIVRHKYLGDVIVATPLVQALRWSFPHAHISFLTRAAYGPLLEYNPNLNEIIAIDAGSTPSSVLPRLRHRKFDLVLDISGTTRTGWLTFLSGAGVRVGRRGVLRRLFYNRFVAEAASSKDTLSATLAFAEGIVPAAPHALPQVFLQQEEKDWAEMYLLSGGIDFERPLLAIHPFSRWPNKNWPFDRFITLVEKLHAAGQQVIFIQGSPDEGPMLQRIMDDLPNPVLCADDLPVRRLAALLARADLFVSNYSGLIHLSAAVGTRVVALFGPDEPHFWFPYQACDGFQAVYEPIDCRPCGLNYCPLATLDCLERIDAETVIAAINRSLVGVS